jgi:hypothetical protein
MKVLAVGGPLAFFYVHMLNFILINIKRQIVVDWI